MGNEATTHFIKQVDMIFNMLNSRNPLAKGYKAPVTKENLSLWLKQCDKVLSYLLSLKDRTKTPDRRSLQDCNLGIYIQYSFPHINCARVSVS